MELKELLGEELYGQVEQKINEHNEGIEDKLQHVRFVDLSEGNYVSKKKYQIGEPCLLYQDTKTGTFALKPDFSDMSRFIFSILPLMLAAAFILSLLGLGLGLAWMGTAGF